MRHIFSAAVISNLIFLISAIAGFVHNQPLLGMLSISIFISSTLYHIFGHSGVQAEYLHNQVVGSRQFVLQIMDSICAAALVLYLVYIFIKQPVDVGSLYDIAILVLVITAPVFFLSDVIKPYYQLFHALWHIFGGLILLLIVFR